MRVLFQSVVVLTIASFSPGSAWAFGKKHDCCGGGTQAQATLSLGAVTTTRTAVVTTGTIVAPVTTRTALFSTRDSFALNRSSLAFGDFGVGATNLMFTTQVPHLSLVAFGGGSAATGTGLEPTRVTTAPKATDPELAKAIQELNKTLQATNTQLEALAKKSGGNPPTNMENPREQPKADVREILAQHDVELEAIRQTVKLQPDVAKKIYERSKERKIAHDAALAEMRRLLNIE